MCVSEKGILKRFWIHSDKASLFFINIDILNKPSFSEFANFCCGIEVAWIQFYFIFLNNEERSHATSSISIDPNLFAIEVSNS